MPELPEVETVVRQLRPHLEGRVIAGVEIRDAKLAWPEGAPAQLRGRRVARVWRHGKQIALELAPQSFGNGEVDKKSKATPGAAVPQSFGSGEVDKKSKATPGAAVPQSFGNGEVDKKSKATPGAAVPQSFGNGEVDKKSKATPGAAAAQSFGSGEVDKKSKATPGAAVPQSFGNGEVDKKSKATPGAGAAAGEALVLLVHLRMTGRLIYCPGEIPTGAQHLRAVVRLDAGWLVFQDTRRFGTMALLAAAELPAPTGLDPTGKAFTATALKRLLAGTRTSIKVWLLRQDRLVGMGNIYASESLFLAGIHPERAGGTLNDGEIARLRGAIRRVLQRSIRAGGTTFSDFRDANGLMGNYARELRVYGHAGEACPACRGVIERVAQGQRSTFFCPQCQPAEPRGGF